MRNIQQCRSESGREQGAALVTALVIMLILTLLGVTAMNMSTLEERMAFNTQDRYMARYLAESLVLRYADNANLPNPAQPGLSYNSYTLTTGSIPNLEAGSARVTFVQQTAFANLPKVNPKATYPSTGGGGSVNPFVFEVAGNATTKAGTSADMESGYFFVPQNQN